MDQPGSTTAEITALLKQGGTEAAGRLLPLIYDELRVLARGKLARAAPMPGMSIGATELVHEAWMRVLGHGDPGWEGRAHFFGAVSNAMRNILVEQARRRSAKKRDAARKQKLPTDMPQVEHKLPLEDVLTVHQALEQLEQEHEREGRVVLLRFFSGLSMPEIAEIVGVSLPTVERDWRFARAWLQDRIGKDLPEDV